MRLYLKLDDVETRAISKLASMEYRDIPSQVLAMIRQELERRGLVPKESVTITEPKANEKEAQ